MNNKTILIAEDDKLIAKAYQDGLSAAGYSVVRATTGEEALELIKKAKPAVVLLDLRMPQKDGFAVLQELQTSGLIKDLSVIVTSNLDQEADIERCKKLGAKDYLVKANHPIDDVIKVVEKYL